MASFCRGLFQPGLQPLFRPAQSFSSPRSILLRDILKARPSARAYASKAKVPPQAPKSQPAKSIPKAQPARTAAPPPTSYGLLRTLAAKSKPTVLYEGPSHFWFRTACWTSGLTLIAWAALTGPSWWVPHLEGFAAWINWVYNISYILFAGMGFFLILKTRGIVSMIRLVPQTSTQTVRAAPVGAATTGLPATTASTPKLEVSVNNSLPFLKPKKIVTDIDKVSLKTRFSLPKEMVPELSRQHALEAEEKAKALKKYDMEHLFTMPFRKIGRGFSGFFRATRSAWTDMGYGVINVDGKQYRVNIERGFALDGFKTLERLVPVKKEA
ncbi:uncharacterized protein F5Z01DRAFT_648446 [Emericellopsis atlantica]|uniref:Uncharacterized protein n=1 Tax=Emericellopsis atlantica TaxID=2614577 RepID=A0A9P8CSK8_9HYPO|nr:uncharacterized protein F5Z01DRAFT_648446 [Emericellopsis atlantica]KAG9257310.1 hypothetical protein F5Z01DRAFT_648446 [Emericellopsis atlantica]